MIDGRLERLVSRQRDLDAVDAWRNEHLSPSTLARHAVTRDFWAGQAKGSDDSGANDYTKFWEAIGQVAVLQQQPIGPASSTACFFLTFPVTAVGS
jgi:hypothetical protein